MEKFIRYFIDNRDVTYLLIVILFVGGIISFFSLGQLEDPVFSIKSATIITEYPGASPQEVELEVTDRIEKAVQEMTQIKEIYSVSEAGRSMIKVDIKDQYWSPHLPQIWNELRNKVSDASKNLPPGSGEPNVGDDFGFVYGFLMALTGDGFNDRELEFFADAAKKELSLVKGVTRVELWGVQPQVIYVDISEQKLKDVGISSETFVTTLGVQNKVVDAGSFDLNQNRLRIAVTGDFKSPNEIGELKIRPSTTDIMSQLINPSGTLKGPLKIGSERLNQIAIEQSDSSNFILLKDLATIRRGYLDPPNTLMRYNGKPAIGIAIAGSDDENIVTVGQRIDEKLNQIEAIAPIGIEIHRVAWQSDVVEESVQSFIINLIEAVIIVLVVLIIPSGFRMGFIIGFDLIITILATFIYMSIEAIPLQRMSLGALIIALGMMVDNAIVVSDSMAVKLRQGMGRIKAAVESAASSAYPLFAATIIAIMAFYPISASDAGAGEYTLTLFYVVAASLFLSWLISMFITPLQCIDLLPDPDLSKGNDNEFNTPLFNKFRKILKTLIRKRNLTMGVLIMTLVVSTVSFQFVEQMFFPDSSRPQLMVDFWAPKGFK